MRFKGYLVREKDEIFSGSLEEIDTPSIESGRVLIKVHYSSLNYKDALAASGAKGVVKSYPFVPGIDVAGEIIESMSPDFSIGDNVLATGYKIGMSEFGGFGEIVHLPSEWVIKMPTKFDFVKAMSYGTAGITAAACIKKITDANCSKELPVIVYSKKSRFLIHLLLNIFLSGFLFTSCFEKAKKLCSPTNNCDT